MNKRQKQVEQALLDDEKAVLQELTDNYTRSLADIKKRIRELMADELTQSKIYQVEYQKNLEAQTTAILDMLKTGNVKTVQDYLKVCYEDGFIGILYDMAGDGLEMILPIDQRQVIAAVTRKTASVKLSARIYKDVAILKRDVISEISRGASQNLSYKDMAINLSNASEASLSRARRIAVTEGHRVQNEAKLDSMIAAKKAGADNVKQWDSTMDSRTRPDHVILDGQIREIDEDFTVNGHRAKCPGHFGVASEDIRCRCALLRRSRWAVDGTWNKYDQDNRREVSTTDESYKAWKNRYFEKVGSAAIGDTIVKDFGSPITGHNGVKDKAVINARTELDKYFQVTGYHCDGKNFIRDDLPDLSKNWITPEKLASRIKDLVQKSGKPVKIYSCNAGAGDATAAQELANSLGVAVKAPIDQIGLTKGGEFKVFKYLDKDSYIVGEYEGDSGWKVFTPTDE